MSNSNAITDILLAWQEEAVAEAIDQVTEILEHKKQELERGHNG